jgi:hypothetical protein
VPKEDNIFDLVERAAARHGIPPLEIWQETARALVEGELPALNLSVEPAPATHPKMTYRAWLIGYRASVDRFNDPRSPVLRHIMVRVSDFEKWFRKWLGNKGKRRRGPTHGTTGYLDADRKQFAAISQLIESGKARAPYGAALILARNRKLAGAGTAESRAKRVAGLYRKECGRWDTETF